jgi:hypothetical protein
MEMLGSVDENIPGYTLIPKALSDLFGNLFTPAVRASRNGNNGHGPLLFLHD